MLIANTIELYLVCRAASYCECTVDTGILYTLNTVHICTSCLVSRMCYHFYSCDYIMEFFSASRLFEAFFSFLVKFNSITVYRVSFVCSTVESLSVLMASSPSSACDWCRPRRKLNCSLPLGKVALKSCLPWVSLSLLFDLAGRHLA